MPAQALDLVARQVHGHPEVEAGALQRRVVDDSQPLEVGLAAEEGLQDPHAPGGEHDDVADVVVDAVVVLVDRGTSDMCTRRPRIGA